MEHEDVERRHCAPVRIAQKNCGDDRRRDPRPVGDNELSTSRPQLDPVEGILAVLDRGSATGTNKFGLLLALVDLAPSVGSDAILPVSRIAEKLIELHWDHARKYPDAPLRQVTSGNKENTTVLLEIIKLRDVVDANLPFERARLKIEELTWREAVNVVARGTIKNPLPRLQQLSGDPPPFLYERLAGSPAQIQFVDGALKALVRYGPVLRDLIEFRFVRFVAKANRATLGTPVEDQLAEHLFGAERHMPPVPMRHDLWTVQQGKCLYTDSAVEDPAGAGTRASSVDHVVPWARVRLSAAENFLITANLTNSAKSDVLLAPELLSRWVNHLSTQQEAIATVAKDYGWPSNLSRVARVASAQYRHASPTIPVWRGQPGLDALGEEGRVRSLEILSSLLE